MPASIQKGRLLTKCDICGKDNPGFGYGVNLRRALDELANKRIDTAKRHLGQWRCAEHRKDRRMVQIKSGEFYEVHSCLGEELAGDRLVDSDDKHGKWVVGETYFCVERTMEGGWEIDDPTYIFADKAEAMRCFDQLEKTEKEMVE